MLQTSRVSNGNQGEGERNKTIVARDDWEEIEKRSGKKKSELGATAEGRKTQEKVYRDGHDGEADKISSDEREAKFGKGEKNEIPKRGVRLYAHDFKEVFRGDGFGNLPGVDFVKDLLVRED